MPYPDEKPWSAKNEVKEAYVGGIVAHCFFPFRETGNVHKKKPVLALPEACPIKTKHAEEFLTLSGIIAPTIEPGQHESTRTLFPCSCGQEPPSKKVIVTDDRFPNVFSYTIGLVISYTDGSVLTHDFKYPGAGYPLDFRNGWTQRPPLEIEAVFISITVDASDTTCAACCATCTMDYVF